MPTFAATRDEYAATWRAMQLDPALRKTFEAVATRLYKSIQLYRMVETLTGVPASVVMVIHERESGGRFDRHLHNGDPLTARTVHVPKGRPVIGDPPFSWQESARDALVHQGMTAVKDWSLERALYELERYNGLGYRNRGLRSPYLWGGTNQQQPGKYVRDGVFDPAVMDQQLGCAGLLASLWAIDPALRIPFASDAAPTPVPPPRPRPPLAPPTPSQQVGLGALIAGIVAGLLMLRDQVMAYLHSVFPFLF